MSLSIFLLINIFVGLVTLLLGYLVCAIIGHPFPGLEEMLGHPWYTAVSLLLCDLAVLLVFWMRKYTNFKFNFGYTYGENFSAKKLYLWAAVAAVGLLIFDLMAGFYLPWRNRHCRYHHADRYYLEGLDGPFCPL